MSVINKMLRDLDSGQAPGSVAKPSMLSGFAAIRDTVSVGGSDKSDRYVYADRFKPFALISLMVVAALVALWYLMGFSNVGKTPSFMLPSALNLPAEQAQPDAKLAAQVASAPALTPTPAETLAKPQADPAPSTDMSSNAPVLAQPQITLPEPVSAMSTLTFARMLADPPANTANTSSSAVLPRPSLPAAKPLPGIPAVPKGSSVAATPSPATMMPAKEQVVSALAMPRAGGPIASKPLVERPATQVESIQAQKQSIVQETLAQAQSLWNAGSKEAAIDLLKEAVTVAERAKSSGNLPMDSPALPSLVRELARMELAEGRASQVLDLLIRLEPVLNNQADLWAVRGNAAQRLGQHQQASNSYLAALKLRPNEPRWMLGAAVSLAAQGQMVAAAALADKARMTGTVSPDVLNYMRQLGVPIR